MTNVITAILDKAPARSISQPTDPAPDHAASVLGTRPRASGRAPAELALAQLLGQPNSATRVTVCPHCATSPIVRFGTTARGRQRFRCKNCLRTSTPATGTPTARLRSPDKLHLLLTDMLSERPSSCRALARTLKVDRMTAWRWRCRLAAALARLNPLVDWSLAEPDRLVLRDSRKASREWLDHRREPKRYPEPDRLRWIDYRLLDIPLPRPMQPYLVDVVLAGDGATAPAALVVRASDRSPSSHGTVGKAPREKTATDHCRPSLPELFGQFLRPFRGPATKHLSAYAGWFVARLPASRTCSPTTPEATG